jgi:fermentation-respiration switch protein FrsA (DUF1100 family)
MMKLIGIWMFEWLWCLSNLIVKPRMLSYEKGFKREVTCGKFNAKAYDNGIKKAFTIYSDYGYALSCELLSPDSDSSNEAKGKRIAVLCHGLGYAKYGSLKYAELFLKLGFTVLIYDHRNHGLSGKAHTSMGYYEKYDLKKVIDWCFMQYGADCKIVTHGESMGAATVLLHLGIDDRVNCVIADCAYSDLKQLLRHQLKQYYHLPRFLIPVESCITYLRAGFWYKEVSPIKIVSQTEIPILFIHGKIDNLVPARMAKQMYASKKVNKAIYLVAGAKHAESFCINREEYEKRVEGFLKVFLN